MRSKKVLKKVEQAQESVEYWLDSEFGGPVTQSDRDWFYRDVRTLLERLKYLERNR